jgi:hypothetical protein
LKKRIARSGAQGILFFQKIAAKSPAALTARYETKNFIAATPKTLAHQKNKVTFAHELGKSQSYIIII